MCIIVQYYSIFFYGILWCVAPCVYRFVSGEVAASLDIRSLDYFRQNLPFGDSAIAQDFLKIRGNRGQSIVFLVGPI